MKSQHNRRALLKSMVFGPLLVNIPNLIFADPGIMKPLQQENPDNLFYRFPAISDEFVSEVVGKSHSDLGRVKELVDKRPELARATWDWGFGDWESAIGAASHMGRRDIVQYLIAKGARPTLFTFAMLGELEVVRAAIKASPGIQSNGGPHGISLLQHARIGLRMEAEMSPEQKAKVEDTIDYLESLGNAEPQPAEAGLNEDEKAKFEGEYRYGEGESDVFFVGLNMRKMMTFGRKGTFGTAIYHTPEGLFKSIAAPSISVAFEQQGDNISGLHYNEPGLQLFAKRM